MSSTSTPTSASVSLRGPLLPPGPLANKSVSCWLTSLIQSMCSCPEFCKAIKRGIKAHGDNDVYSGFYSFISKCEDGYNTSECATDILSALNKINRDSMRNIKLNQKQQCALEFFENIIEVLHYPAIYDLFKTYFLRETTCKHPSCGHVECVKSMHMYVPIYKGSEEETFHDPKKYPNTNRLVLDILGHVEKIDRYRCPKCQQESIDTESVYRLCTLPKIFVLQFDKATNNTPVMLVDKFCLTERNSGKDVWYHANATVCHYGITTGGHYTANCLRKCPKTRGPKWFNCNDLFISELTSVPLHSTDIYLAFYSRQD